MPDSATMEAVNIDQDNGNFSYAEDYLFDAGTGLSEGTVDYISDINGEAECMREFRQRAPKVFYTSPMPPA